MQINSTLDLTPEQKELRRRYKLLKREFSKLFTLKNEMISHKLPFLTSLYLELIGRKLYEIYCLNVELSKLKRRMTLLQAYVNRNEAPNLAKVDQEIEIQFAKYQKKIEEEAENLAAARKLLTSATFLTEEETKELKELYYSIVKRLHPDINPNLSEEDKDLFVKAQVAYELLELQTLRMIFLSLDLTNKSEIADYNLKKMVEKLAANIEKLRSQIDKLNNSFPFIYKEKLLDEKWVKSKQDEADKQIETIKIEIEKHKTYVTLLEEWKPEFQS